jgi:hypothetical protein
LLSFCIQEFGSEPDANDTERALLCEFRNLERSATAEWSLTLETPVLVGRDKDYYCTGELELPLQSEVADLGATSAQLSCELGLVDITGLDRLALSVAGLPASGGRFLGGEAGSQNALSVGVAANLDGVYSAAAGDSGTSDQRVANICVSSEFGRSCGVDFEYNQGQDGLYSPNYRAIGSSVGVGQQISISCDAQSGRYARCQQFLQFSLNSQEAVNLFADGVVDSSKIVKTSYSPDQLQAYCSAGQPFFIAARGNLVITDATDTSACQ